MFYIPLVGLVMIIVVMAWMQAREAVLIDSQRRRESSLLDSLAKRDKAIESIVSGFLQHIGTEDK